MLEKENAMSRKINKITELKNYQHIILYENKQKNKYTLNTDHTERKTNI